MRSLLRVGFIATLLFSSSLSPAQSVRDRISSRYSQFTRWVGGAGSCPQVSAEAFRAFDRCARANYTGPLRNVDRLALAETVVVTELAGNAQDAVNCMHPMLQAYNPSRPDSPTTKSLNDAAFPKFQEALPDLNVAKRAMEDLDRLMEPELRRCGYAGDAMEACTQATLERYRPHYEKVETAVATIVARIPLGHVDSVKEEIFRIVRRGTRDEASFRRAYGVGVTKFRDYVAEYKAELDDAVSYGVNGSRSFDMAKIPSVRQDLIQSEQYTERLNVYGANNSVNEALMCRRRAEFSRGPGRIHGAVVALSILSFAATLGTSGAAAGIGGLSAETIATIRTADFAFQLAITPPFVIQAGAMMASSCGTVPALIPPNGRRACSVQEAFNGTIARSRGNECLKGIGLEIINGLYIGGVLKNALRR